MTFSGRCLSMLRHLTGPLFQCVGEHMAKQILLVEDNPDNRTIYRMILEHSGFTVLEAVDGEEGLRLAREGDPDLILMDISIPKLDGWEVAKILKDEEATRDIPIIALTAHAMASDRDRAEAAGFDGYLAKPVEPRRVVEEVRRHLGEVESEPA